MMCFASVGEKIKTYKLYDHVSKKIIVSKDVVFEESKSWNLNKPSGKPSSLYGINDDEAVENDYDVNQSSPLVNQHEPSYHVNQPSPPRDYKPINQDTVE